MQKRRRHQNYPRKISQPAICFYQVCCKNRNISDYQKSFKRRYFKIHFYFRVFVQKICRAVIHQNRNVSINKRGQVMKFVCYNCDCSAFRAINLNLAGFVFGRKSAFYFVKTEIFRKSFCRLFVRRGDITIPVTSKNFV